MLKQRLILGILTILIFGIFFQGINAHNNNLFGFHQMLVWGFPHALVYKSGKNSFTASATCTAEAAGPFSPDDLISGVYAITARASDNPQGNGDPGNTVTNMFVNDLFDWVSDDKTQLTTPTGLWAMAMGGANAFYYRKIVFDENDPVWGWRWIILYHQHDEELINKWYDFADSTDVEN